MAEYRVKSTNCPRCKIPIDAATTVAGDDQNPKAGDYTICVECGGWLRFTDDLDVRSVTADEITRMPRSLMLAFARTSLACKIARRIKPKG